MDGDQKRYDGGVAEAGGGPGTEEESRFRNFVAIQDVPPQRTLFLTVEGEVWVGNPGVEVSLSYAVPQGVNPTILLLRVDLAQRPGMWPQVMTWKPCEYRTMLEEHGQYRQVQLTHPQMQGITIDVVDRE